MFRVLIWLLELGVLFAVAAFAFVALCAAGRSFVGILRAAANLAIAGAISGMIGLGFGIGGAALGTADPVADGLLAAILSLPVMSWALSRIGRRRRERRGEAVLEYRARSALAPEPATDGDVAVAWGRAVRLAPAQRQRLAMAREACAYVLHMSEAHPLDMETMECAVLIRKRLPELVDKTASYCTLAGKHERRGVIEDMVGDIESLGRMALLRVERSKAELGESLAATRAHIASRTSETPAF